jgi:predicted permease
MESSRNFLQNIVLYTQKNTLRENKFVFYLLNPCLNFTSLERSNEMLYM